MHELPMFPLGTVLIPGVVLPLHIFEPRYRRLMEVLGGDGGTPDGGEFGVVLIERGSEVGGGDVRSRTGTVARVIESRRLEDGRWLVAAVGERRIRVTDWLSDDPYPRAAVEELGEPGWIGDGDDLAEAARAVRRVLALAAEFGEQGLPVTFDLLDDPVMAVWQLCALAPLGPHDRQLLLAEDDPQARLRRLRDLVDDVGATLAFRLGQGP